MMETESVVIRSMSGEVLYEAPVGTHTMLEAVEAAVVAGTDLRGADLRGADLRGADLRGANLRGANLSDTDLINTYLRGADLRWAELRGADLRGADLREAELRWADLRGANLRDATLRGANLTRAHLSDATLHGADLTRAILTDADLTGATLTGAVLSTDETWETYLAETVPSLLTAGGHPLEDCVPHWVCHDWENCPIAWAFDVHQLSDVPVLYRPRAAQFVQFFDARLIPCPVTPSDARYERNEPW